MLVEDSERADVGARVPCQLASPTPAFAKMNESTAGSGRLRREIDRLQAVHSEVDEGRLEMNTADTRSHSIDDDVVEEHENTRETSTGEALELRRGSFDDAERAGTRCATAAGGTSSPEFFDPPSVLSVGREFLDFGNDLAQRRGDQTIRSLAEVSSRLDGVAAVVPKSAVFVEECFGSCTHGCDRRCLTARH